MARSGLATVAVALTVSLSPAVAADLTARQIAEAVAVPPTLLPAVSGINLSVEAAGGGVRGNSPLGSGGYGHLGASLSVPVGAQFGAQVDVLAAKVDGLSFLGAGGHAFWRDPARSLFGVYAEALTADYGPDRLNKGRLGVETEAYLGNVTLSGIAGYEWGNRDIRDGLFAEALAGVYLTEDLKVTGGYGYGFSGHMGTARLDWQLPASTGFGNVVVFAEGRVAEGGYAAAYAGVKLQFGAPQKSLQRRQREDDPPVWLASQPHAVAAGYAQRPTGGGFAEPTDCGDAWDRYHETAPGSDERSQLSAWMRDHDCRG
jgi:hypothetical protein